MRGLGSLFERLAEVRLQPPGFSEQEQLTASIATHLSNMLGARAGSVKMLPDYGLPDLNDMSMSAHDILRQSRVAIEKAVRLYEPRLSEVYVMSEGHSENRLTLQFFIDATLKADGIKKAVRFSATVSEAGRVRVS
ncbi:MULTISPECIES: type VI secretion system baseplate subunit TssE [Pseudomonas]|uniref:Type VI secretion system lysozyme-related protein n=2 Tax=Pseudomonas syringae group TaxID=136849 RepID=A0A3M4ISU5_PSEVI|nr:MULTISPECIES: type VI secretion system baseplate subunit TssE [Pseudomonas]KTB75107.1 type VI secretion protein [Pseudomonas sp. ICMP 3272]KTC57145.1 type VI secretion protein [Pseudomonas syringae ICMP 19498]RMQ07866.1 Type VI secretion system lysozyme-related protein [Pseudomonas viridiflava]RMQ79742.1 Type VI secretion system lysozyme-related protein [Pseudomonas viridiflava]